jgi:two-component system response regulator RegA
MHQSILIVDEHESFASSLAQSLRSVERRVSVASDFQMAEAIARVQRPTVIVTELKVGNAWALAALPGLREASPGSRLAVLTAYPSVAAAVQMVRKGVDAFMVKPVSTPLLLGLLGLNQGGVSPERMDEPAWPSLDRTIWEYLNQVVKMAPSVSEAARRLHLDRRSLRRMLAKPPPAF